MPTLAGDILNPTKYSLVSKQFASKHANACRNRTTSTVSNCNNNTIRPISAIERHCVDRNRIVSSMPSLSETDNFDMSVRTLTLTGTDAFWRCFDKFCQVSGTTLNCFDKSVRGCKAWQSHDKACQHMSKFCQSMSEYVRIMSRHVMSCHVMVRQCRQSPPNHVKLSKLVTACQSMSKYLLVHAKFRFIYGSSCRARRSEPKSSYGQEYSAWWPSAIHAPKILQYGVYIYISTLSGTACTGWNQLDLRNRTQTKQPRT